MEKYSKGEIAKIILGTLIVGGLIVTLSVAPGFGHIIKLFNAGNAKERARIKRSIEILKRNKCLRFYTNKDGEKVFVITGKGYRDYHYTKLQDLKTKKPKQWDAVWSVIVFDIPENRKVARNSINRKLKELGFYPLQKSTFVYPFECKKEIQFITDYYKVKDCVRYIRAQKIEDDEIIKKHFGFAA